ncbi:FHA domain-containing protein [Citrus sinensis]|uniref:FHA domain-containing protein n=1 Tax=Citrus sinensis TaxID=2711 RepID=A0ACB8K511_CITSI|nr:FHA domain-containing protein [Citrus sinensis]
MTTTDADPDASTVTDVPPPPPKLLAPAEEAPASCSTATTTVARMGPPPPKNPNPNTENSSNDTPHQEEQPNSFAAPVQKQPSSVPYKIPEWSGSPCHKFYLEVLKDGSIVDQYDVCNKGAYMFGRVDLCDFVLEHSTISRFHAVIQFKRSGDAYLYDVGSTHGTFINKNQVEKRVYVDLHVGDVIRFGQSSRLYIFQGPPDLMPPEKDLNLIRESKIQQEILDREDSLRRARLDASCADGISWGMGEDAIEEAEIAHMKREIDLIRAKDISQGGLTQGQQTQIARNEQRIAQIMEELENLEETLNESIRESFGARSGNTYRGKKKGMGEDEEDFLSDDDEFYDRTKKKPSIQKANESQSIETADTLLDKRDVIMKEMEDKKELFEKEKDKMASETDVETESGDALDAYMSGLSSQLVLDKTMQHQKELSTLQSELDRILYLLKFADPTGEATKRRDLKVQVENFQKSEKSTTDIKKKAPTEPKKSSGSGKPVNVSVQKETTPVTAVEINKKPEADKIVSDANEEKTSAYAIPKPQWLGAVEDREMKAIQREDEGLHVEESEQFVGYKERQKMLKNTDDAFLKVDSMIEDASGLIIRKKNQVDKPDDNTLDQSTSSSARTQFKAEDAVALLLKHKRGYHADDDEVKSESQESVGTNQSRNDTKRPRRVLGPEKPAFLNIDTDYESWVPPEGDSLLFF